MKLDEFSLISFLSRKLPLFHSEVVVGIGDDTAVLKSDKGYSFLTTDVLVEGVHFLDSWKKLVKDFYYLLGKKLVAVSVSDVASMGGMPVYGLINLLLPENYLLKEVEEVYSGISDACSFFKISVVGGDTSRALERMFSFFLKGEGKGFMLRSNARVGDLVAVTGTLGDSAAGLEQLLRNRVEDYKLVDKFLSPVARVREGMEACKLGILTCTDVSDGLIFNLYTIAEASCVAIRIDSSKIPVSSSLLSFAGDKKRALNYALYGGEDYELIVTFEEKLVDKVESLGFRVIGEVVDGEGVFVDGVRVEKKGYDHFGGGS